MDPTGSRELLGAWLLAAALAAHSAAQPHPEIVVGVDGSGRLVARVDPERLHPLAASRFPGIDGYADAFPGFSSLFEARPDDGLLLADPASSLEFVLLAADEGLAVWNDHGTGPMQVGESFSLGHPPFDSHPLWRCLPGEAGRRYEVRLQLRDTTGRHAASEPFVAAFTPDDSATLYVCPMACGGGNTFAAPGRCPVCDMRLKLLSARSHRVSVTPVAGAGAEVRAGIATPLRFGLQGPDGSPVTDLEVVHEKLLHLLIVSDDLSWFAHEHPEMQGDGSLLLPLTFPHGGGFTLYHDFTPRSVGMQVVPVELRVAGEEPAPVPLDVDSREPRQVDGYTVSLGAPRVLRSLVDQRLAFRIERDGAPVTDLQPFLGALGHLIVVSQDRSRFVHSHPLPPPVLPGAAPAAPPAGPEVVFHAFFPAPGRYKAWAQFQHAGRVLTAPFVFDVTAP